MPGRGFFTGSGLLLALVGGGIALNASLFNGTYVNCVEMSPLTARAACS